MDMRTLHTDHGLQTHPSGNGILLLTYAGYKPDTWITCPITNVSNEKNKKPHAEVARISTACKVRHSPLDFYKLRKQHIHTQGRCH